jgi:hypothetical protein
MISNCNGIRLSMCTEQVGSDGKLLTSVQLITDMDLSQDTSYAD